MSKRKQLVVSLIAVPAAFIAFALMETLAAKPAGSPGGAGPAFGPLLPLTMLWAFFGPAFFAARYAKELGMPSGLWGLLSVFFPVITPAALAAVSRPPLPALTPELNLAGKTLREWGLGDPTRAARRLAFLGFGGSTIVLMEKGVVGDGGALAGAFLWTDVREIYQELRDQYMNGMQTVRKREYTLKLADGRVVVVNERYGSIDELGGLLQLRVTAALRPRASEALARGESLACGPLVLSPTTIAVKRKALPWAEVEGVRLNAGYLVISKRADRDAERALRRTLDATAAALTRIAGRAQPMVGGDGVRWEKISVDRVPNVYLVVALAEELVTQARVSGSRVPERVIA